MSEQKKIPLCKDCTFFIHSTSVCGRSFHGPDYVFGAAPQNFLAQTERSSPGEKDCGPEAKFFLPIVPADAYAETMIRRDREQRHTGCTEDDLDIACRKLQAGS